MNTADNCPECGGPMVTAQDGRRVCPIEQAQLIALHGIRTTYSGPMPSPQYTCVVPGCPGNHKSKWLTC